VTAHLLLLSCSAAPEILDGPTQAIVASDGLVYVTDGYFHARVAVFTPEGRFVRDWGSKGFERGHFVSALPLENRDRDQVALRFGGGALVHAQRFTISASIGLDGPYGAFQSSPHPWWGVGVTADVSLGEPRR
jgi:hypothetical protein